MTTTTNLLIEHIVTAQAQKEVTANEAFDTLDKAIAGELIHDFASDADYTLDTSEPDKEHENLVLRLTDTGTNLTTARNVVIPAQKQLHLIYNETLYDLTIKTPSGSGVAILAGSNGFVYCDDTDCEATTGENVAYDFNVYYNGVPGNSQELTRLPAVRAYTVPITMAGSDLDAGAAATAETVISFKKNGSEFGTATVAISGTSATFAAASATSFSVGDVLTVVCPASADATLADIGITIKASRS
jgi:hypothetical protein